MSQLQQKQQMQNGNMHELQNVNGNDHEVERNRVIESIRQQISELEAKDVWLKKQNQKTKELSKWKGEDKCMCQIF
ncbi:hypothetical protein TTHERM_000497759 (macronuclear) [Tetrahymena thermophila SB210]|uniref:Uncharacterized protein n=1 Tax=Tetrahymena thermophila (strain SB210) TaxID=312017 RepID=W7WVW3_TETTS|nr:hypothetical protein TTHERM_000497759 [Tetrahymena thermophila SB210]EWS70960.1 hypothetical protein TTHERM_000497759 [Tetrahymena thermophila SB210]|eukprot:XP_012656516.1 hypothetical protein TTHERM_000497759 [Tetrahymena thermophila SB210]